MAIRSNVGSNRYASDAELKRMIEVYCAAVERNAPPDVVRRLGQESTRAFHHRWPTIFASDEEEPYEGKSVGDSRKPQTVLA